MLVYQGTRGNDARHPSGICGLTLGFCWGIIEKFVTDGDMFVEVLYQDLKVAIQLVGGKSGLRSKY
jgi:hypothetical protein